MERMLRAAREEFFKKHWILNAGHYPPIKFRETTAKSRDTKQIICIILCHPQDLNFASHFRQLLMHCSTNNSFVSDPPSWTVFILTTDNSRKLQLLETASVLVPLLSAPFCSQNTTLNLLHVCISLSRSKKVILQPLIISHLPLHPSFFHLLPTPIHCEDQVSKTCNM